MQQLVSLYIMCECHIFLIVHVTSHCMFIYPFNKFDKGRPSGKMVQSVFVNKLPMKKKIFRINIFLRINWF